MEIFFCIYFLSDRIAAPIVPKQQCCAFLHNIDHLSTNLLPSEPKHENFLLTAFCSKTNQCSAQARISRPNIKAKNSAWTQPRKEIVWLGPKRTKTSPAQVCRKKKEAQPSQSNERRLGRIRLGARPVPMQISKTNFVNLSPC